MTTGFLRIVARLHARGLEELPLLRGRLALETFSVAVERSVAHRFRDESPKPTTLATYIESLNAADLGLAIVCDAGDDDVWEHVVLTYRPLLYRAAGVLTGADDTGRELADTLWAELYGVGRTRGSLEPGAERHSLFRYFHGRCKLSTWLRSVLAQRHVDLRRTHRRTESLDPETDSEAAPSRSSGQRDGRTDETTDPDQRRFADLFQQTLQNALAALPPRDRLRLAYYYAQSLTLAETGRLLEEHEATVSRKLARTRAQLRRTVEATMRERHRLTPTEIDLCYQYVVEEGSMDLTALDP